MIKSIRHLRGTEAQWLASDIVIPDGEIAIVNTEGGNRRLKIGNGIDKFSSLPYLSGNSVESVSEQITLEHGRSYRLGTASYLTVTFPDKLDDDYYSEISFDSGDDATEFAVNGRLRLTGDDVADEELMPKPNFHYTVFVWYDGALQGIVRGLPNA